MKLRSALALIPLAMLALGQSDCPDGTETPCPEDGLPGACVPLTPSEAPATPTPPLLTPSPTIEGGDEYISPDDVAAVEASIAGAIAAEWPDAGGPTQHRLPFEAGDHMGITQGPYCGNHASGTPGAVDFNVLGGTYESSHDMRAVASKPGTVTIAGPNGGYGTMVKIRHTDGTFSLYAHMDILLVSQGEEVCQGQRLGRIAQTGNSTGDHLHYEQYDANGIRITAPSFQELPVVSAGCDPCTTSTHTAGCYESRNTEQCGVDFSCSHQSQLPEGIIDDLYPGDSQTVEVRFRNESNVTWLQQGSGEEIENGVVLKACDASGNPLDSPLHHSSWYGDRTPGSMEQASVPPGQVATFRFVIKVKEGATPSPSSPERHYFIPYHRQLGAQPATCFDGTHFQVAVQDPGCDGVCAPGEEQIDACGNCGTRTRRCNAQCEWGSWSGCVGQGECSPGVTQTCPAGCGTQTCTNSCIWRDCTAAENAPGCIDFYRDGDRDGYGSGAPRCLCGETGDYRATRAGDCDDGRAWVNPELEMFRVVSLYRAAPDEDSVWKDHLTTIRWKQGGSWEPTPDYLHFLHDVSHPYEKADPHVLGYSVKSFPANFDPGSQWRKLRRSNNTTCRDHLTHTADTPPSDHAHGCGDYSLNPPFDMSRDNLGWVMTEDLGGWTHHFDRAWTTYDGRRNHRMAADQAQLDCLTGDDNGACPYPGRYSADGSAGWIFNYDLSDPSCGFPSP